METGKKPRLDSTILSNARKLRHYLTPTEKKLWQVLNNRQLAGIKFRRQHPIGPFIVDFCCLSCKLVIEIDGPSHDEQADYDQSRTDWLNEQGYKLIRFSNRDVLDNLEGVVEAILLEYNQLSGSN